MTSVKPWRVAGVGFCLAALTGAVWLRNRGSDLAGVFSLLMLLPLVVLCVVTWWSQRASDDSEDGPSSWRVEIVLTTATSAAFDNERFSSELDALLIRQLGDADPDGEGWLTIYSYLTGPEHERAQQFFE